jgi:hypothetical protein
VDFVTGFDKTMEDSNNNVIVLEGIWKCSKKNPDLYNVGI